jgi:hypothetical protein
MAGVLLYTAAPDSEGTLGGLVSLGEPRTFDGTDQALECMRLCASGPALRRACAHAGRLTLHGPHATPASSPRRPPVNAETSTSDRAVLVETVEPGDIASSQPRAPRVPVPPEPGTDEELPLVAEPPEGSQQQPRRPRSA